MSSSKDPVNASTIKRKAFKSLIQKARNSGQSEDLYNLGLLHLRGNGIKQDTLRAMELFTRFAEKGDAGAMQVQSLVMLSDISTELPYMSKPEGECLIKAPMAGHPPAMNNLGVAYAAGLHGFPMNRIRAVHWF